MNKLQDRNAPISAGAFYDVPIEDIAREGNGIAHIQRFVFLVPGTKVGDHIRISIEQGVRKFANNSTCLDFLKRTKLGE